jgi:imidazolonepropionase-like amidohydrolase
VISGILALSIASCNSDPGGPVAALVGGTIIDGKGGPPRTGETILVQDGRILEVGAEVRVPRDAEVMDLAGKTVVPGLIDMHGHMYAMGANQFEAYPALFLAGGATTVFSPGDFDPEGMTALRDQIAAGEVVGPRILTAGPYFDADPSIVSWIEGVGSGEEVRAKFEAWKDRIDAVKIYAGFPEELFRVLVPLADEAGFKITGHLGGPLPTTRAIEMGIDGLEHGVFQVAELVNVSPTDPINDQYCAVAALDMESREVAAVIDAIVEHGVWVTPTIVTMESIHPGFVPPTADWGDYLSTRMYEMVSGMPAFLNEEGTACLEAALERQLEFVRSIHRKGGLVVTGTDPVSPKITPGYGLHAEMANLVEAGFTPIEAITAATRDAARALGLDGEIGTIEVGKAADLVVIDGDPAEDIRQIGNTEVVLMGGVLHDPATLRASARGKIKLAGEEM